MTTSGTWWRCRAGSGSRVSRLARGRSGEAAPRQGSCQVVGRREQLSFQTRALTGPFDLEELPCPVLGAGHGRFLRVNPPWRTQGEGHPRPGDSPAHTPAEGGPWVWLSEKLYRCLPDCRRGGNTALRRPFRGSEEDVFFQEASLQPLPENDPVHGNVGHEPAMGDPIEAGFNVAFEHPGGAMVVAQEVFD